MLIFIAGLLAILCSSVCSVRVFALFECLLCSSVCSVRVFALFECLLCLSVFSVLYECVHVAVRSSTDPNMYLPLRNLYDILMAYTRA